MSELTLSLTHLSRPPQRPVTGRAPGLILLHGYGSNEQDLMGLAPFLDGRLHVLSVRAPIALGSWMYAWYHIQFLPGGEFRFSEAEVQRSLEGVAQFLDEAVAAYDLDPARLFIGGFSQGAIQSVATLLLHPEKIAGVVAMSGRWPTGIERDRAPDARLAGKPILVTHGQHDDLIPVRYGRTLRDQLQHLPLSLQFEEFPMGHTVNEESLALASGWLSARLDEIG